MSTKKRVMEEIADYQQGYEDGIATERESNINAYHDGYRRGYRDSRADRYGFGWYNGLMMGTLGTIICGIVLHMTGASTKSNEIPYQKR